MMDTQISNASGLERATPESQGVESAAIAALVRGANAGDFGFHSLMVLRHGRVIAEGWWAPYTAGGTPHDVLGFQVSDRNGDRDARGGRACRFGGGNALRLPNAGI